MEGSIATIYAILLDFFSMAHLNVLLLPEVTKSLKFTPIGGQPRPQNHTRAAAWVPWVGVSHMTSSGGGGGFVPIPEYGRSIMGRSSPAWAGSVSINQLDAWAGG